MSSPHIHIPPKIKYSRQNGAYDVFKVRERIGKGSYGVVNRVTHLNTHKSYAMKIISKKQYDNEKGQIFLEQMKNEIVIQKNLDHPNIVGYKLSFSDKYNQYIVLEYCPGQTVFDYLEKSKEKRLSEPETRQILKDVINGLIYLHNRKIIHHDIKLENFLIGSDGKIKISDFGISSILKDKNHKSYINCGTLAYMSPEMIIDDGINGHGLEVDIWSVGVCTFLMLTGRLPFEGPDEETIEEKIKNCEYSFPNSNPKLSSEAKNFIKKIFQIDPKKRLSLIDLIDHPFLTKLDNKKIKFYRPSKDHSIQNKLHNQNTKQVKIEIKNDAQ